MAKTAEWTVYWLYDSRCFCYFRHGYVGISKNIRRRLIRHRYSAKHGHNDRLPETFECKILFRGSYRECLMLEFSLRPRPCVGWNLGIGGCADGSMLAGVPQTAKHRERIRAAALARYAKPGEKERASEIGKAAFKAIDRAGANNAMYGRKQSETTKQKIRDRIAEHGGRAGKRNGNYRHGRYC
jgi:hypothetical protein